MSKLKNADVEPLKPDAAPELKKISLKVNEFGEIVRDVKMEQINAFLDQNVPDKKFTEEEKDK